MRLIDADKLRFRHTVKCNADTTRPYTLNCISFDEVQNAPTIKAVPIDVLDKIRAEIKSLQNANPSYWHSGDMVDRDDVLEIIDKYTEVRE